MKEKTSLVLISPNKKRKRMKLGDSLYDALIDMNIPIRSLCSGRGTCGRCKIQVEKGENHLNNLTQTEYIFLTTEEINQGFRLACQAKITNSFGIISIKLPERSIIDKQSFQLEGISREVELNPLLNKFFIKINPPTLKDSRSDEERLLKSLFNMTGIEPEDIFIKNNLFPKLSKILRQYDWEATIVKWKNQILNIEGNNTSDHLYGLAFDLGTTKVAGYLIDLKTGTTIYQHAEMNKQVSCGEDVISRISYVINGNQSGLNRIKKLAVSTLNTIIKICCEKSDIKYQDIYEIVLVGNTCMQQLLLGLDPMYLSKAPYTPTLSRSLDLPSKSVGLYSNENANLHIAPIIGGFIGGDCIAAILASGMLLSSDISMLIDIGTNTEIVLGNQDGAKAVSCASGPAFEGMHIKCGIRATSGAISKVKVDANNPDNIKVDTVNNEKPIGICGSAIVDLPAELLKARLISKFGAFNKHREKDLKRVREGRNGMEYVVSWKEENDLNKNIIFTQTDIREIQKAKAAIHTGASLLMDLMNCKIEDIENVYLAGAFGCYIDPENASIIGMYPEFPIKKFNFIGNAAGSGARLMLLSEEQRNISKKIKDIVKYYELATHPRFQEEFINSTLFPHKYLNLFPNSTKYLNLDS
jgi:uncharacterized 2Fe-2S/4Fe-4S cluster protein (DUF4445 family)